MAKFINMTVGSETMTFSGENFVDAARVSDTSTVIMYFGATITLTHADDTPPADGEVTVRQAIRNAILALHQPATANTNRQAYVTVDLPVAVSAAVTEVIVPAA